MPDALALLALTAAAAALWVAGTARIRARRAVEALRRLREEVAAAPAPPAPAAASDRDDRLAGETDALLRRVLALEAREAARDVAPPPPGPAPRAPAPPVVPVARLREHLAAQGYDVVHAVPVDATGREFGVEARRSGAVWKGLARVDEQGRVTARLDPALRAFP